MEIKGQHMNQEIEKANYVEWVKLIQRAYTIGYICAFVILSHILTLDISTTSDTLNLPILSVAIPRLPAALFTLFVFIVCGAFIIFAYAKLENICKVFDDDTLRSLRNFPSIAHSSLTVELLVVIGLCSIFCIIFLNGKGDVGFLKSLFMSCIVCITFIIAWSFKAYRNHLIEVQNVTKSQAR